MVWKTYYHSIYILKEMHRHLGVYQYNHNFVLCPNFLVRKWPIFSVGPVEKKRGERVRERRFRSVVIQAFISYKVISQQHWVYISHSSLLYSQYQVNARYEYIGIQLRCLTLKKVKKQLQLSCSSCRWLWDQQVLYKACLHGCFFLVIRFLHSTPKLEKQNPKT